MKNILHSPINSSWKCLIFFLFMFLFLQNNSVGKETEFEFAASDSCATFNGLLASISSHFRYYANHFMSDAFAACYQDIVGSVSVEVMFKDCFNYLGMIENESLFFGIGCTSLVFFSTNNDDFGAHVIADFKSSGTPIGYGIGACQNITNKISRTKLT